MSEAAFFPPNRCPRAHFTAHVARELMLPYSFAPQILPGSVLFSGVQSKRERIYQAIDWHRNTNICELWGEQ